jgi:hypothetical protein
VPEGISLRQVQIFILALGSKGKQQVKPSELNNQFEAFKTEVSKLTDDELLDKWIGFIDSAEEKEEDLGILKSNCLEAALIQKFGPEYHIAVKQRKATLATNTSKQEAGQRKTPLPKTDNGVKAR